MNHDLRHVRVITLIVKAESLDALLRREDRAPLEVERVQYELLVGELARRGEVKVLPYYQSRLDEVYRPRPRYAPESTEMFLKSE